MADKYQMLKNRHSAAVGRQESVGYEVYADIVKKTDGPYTCATESRSNE
jgi:hypothetical protein